MSSIKNIAQIEKRLSELIRPSKQWSKTTGQLNFWVCRTAAAIENWYHLKIILVRMFSVFATGKTLFD